MRNLNWRDFISFAHKSYCLYSNGEECVNSLIRLSNILILVSVIVPLAMKTPNRQGS